MALMLGQLYDALRAGNVPDDKARAAAEEVANYEGELTKLRVDIDRRFTEMGERISRVEADVAAPQMDDGLCARVPGCQLLFAVALGETVMTDAIKFTLDGREVEARPGETIWQVAKRQGTDIPHLCWLPEPGYRADGNCRACMVEIEGERVLAASCIRKPTAGMKVVTASDRAKTARKMVMELLLADQPERAVAHHPELQAVAVGGPDGRERLALPGTREPDARPQPPRDGGAPGRLHPLQSVRARLPRGAGQRRHRHGVPQRRLEDRVRHGRSDGWQHLRRLRRVRPGLPHGRPDAVFDRRRAGRRPSGGRPPGRQRVPVLRRRLPDHLSHQGRQDPLRDGTQRPGE